MIYCNCKRRSDKGVATRAIELRKQFPKYSAGKITGIILKETDKGGTACDTGPRRCPTQTRGYVDEALGEAPRGKKPSCATPCGRSGACGTGTVACPLVPDFMGA